MYSDIIQNLETWLEQQIVGQPRMVQRLIIALLADGHLLVEGAPGLAKTKAIKELARGLEASFHRIQFTPDLLPGDVTGTEIYRPEQASFVFQPGPVFHNLVLADEINRAPAKVQSALLEAMAERQVSIGAASYPLPAMFLVMATQNPIEQEGTYPLPEAQLDRFLMHVRVDYPNTEAERQILALARQEADGRAADPPSRVSESSILEARRDILSLHMAPSVEEYLVQIVLGTRLLDDGPVGKWLDYGASPRGTIALDRCSRAHAWLHGRDYVTPDDVQSVAHDVLRHRLILNFEAEAQGIGPDQVIDGLLASVPAP